MSRPRTAAPRPGGQRPNGLPRGIASELLVSQVRNTAPYVFDDREDGALVRASIPAVIVREWSPVDEPLSHAGYFRLCLAAHYLTCATLVPTDVDNQIRHRLWAPGLPLEVALEMARLVVESRGWDFAALTARGVRGAAGSEAAGTFLCGHAGEWFTVAAAAYAALDRYAAREALALRSELLDAIADETRRHSEVFGSSWRARDGVSTLKAAATVAHDFGDLDRVIETWAVPITDPLRREFFQLTITPFDHERRLRHKGRLWAAGELYKSVIDGSSMALENHRHFALRKPRGLRTHPALRVPLGPFFDAWGAEVAARLDGEALLEVLDALVRGAERMAKTQSYVRALQAIRAARPELDARVASVARSHRKLFSRSREEHERLWSDTALALLEEIPGRA